MDPDEESLPDRCVLQHRIFSTHGAVSFRRAKADGMPVMIVPFGEREAAIPLRSLQREFGIDDASIDGRMLGRIVESLDYVQALSLGDKLPGEVLDGTASWEPDLKHRTLAFGKLRVQLLSWLDPSVKEQASCDLSCGDPFERLDTDLSLRQQVQRAFEQAAVALQLPDSKAVVSLMEELAGELAYIEALRDRLLRPVQQLTARLERLRQDYRGDHQRQEVITRVVRLAILARNQLMARFDEVAAQTGEVMSALCHIDSQAAFIRSTRDQLYRTQRAWQAILDAWQGVDRMQDEVTWQLVSRTYHFLAPRFMPVTEWPTEGAMHRQRAAPKQLLAHKTKR